MSASAAVRGLLRIPRAGPAIHRIEAEEDTVPQFGWDARMESIRNILGQGGHTISQLSAATRRRYGNRSPHFIPATFLYKLRSGVMPHVCQIVALSESTGYRFVDWVRMFGFDLTQIPRLQMRLHTERTVLITPVEDGFESFLRSDHSLRDHSLRDRSLRDRSFGDRSFSDHSFRDHSLSDHSLNDRSLDNEGWWRSFRDDDPGGWSPGRRYLFAKIGMGDATALPGLVPGGIVRIDRHYARRVRSLERASASDLLWLVEQPEGLTCCPVRWIDDRQIVLLPSRPPWGCWPLRLPTEARILGLVDRQLRPTIESGIQPGSGLDQLFGRDILPRDHRKRDHRIEDDGKEGPSEREEDQKEERLRFSDLLRISRGRTGLTFRAAQQLTRAIAQILGNREYAIALGLLSDYEAMGNLPRHVAKIFSLCVIYCMDIWKLMEAAGVYVDDSAKLPLPLPDFRLQTHSDFLENAMSHESADVVARYAQSAGR